MARQSTFLLAGAPPAVAWTRPDRAWTNVGLQDMSRGSDVSPSLAGQAIYSPTVLNIYDALVLGISNRWIWCCPTQKILQLYNDHVTDEHLDVGVGTGWYLDRCRFPSSMPRLGLLDLNANALEKASARVARYHPEARRADVLTPIHAVETPYRSISLTYLLHCLPGAMRDKAVAFDNIQALLSGDGVVFGATLLSSGVPMTRAARRLMALYNRRGIFSNAEDDPNALRDALRSRFRKVELELIGCAALFVARDPLQQP